MVITEDLVQAELCVLTEDPLLYLLQFGTAIPEPVKRNSALKNANRS